MIRKYTIGLCATNHGAEAFYLSERNETNSSVDNDDD
jgi:hypothetical protein